MTVAKPTETRKTRASAPQIRTRARRAPIPARAGSGRLQPARAGLDADGTIAALEALRDNLDATAEKLALVDEKRLSDEDFREFARQRHAVNLAVNAARNATLEAISAKFRAELPAINAATGRLRTDLQKLKDSVQIIQGVASFLGIIQNVVKLLA